MVETTVEASFDVRVYIIPKSENQKNRLESEIDHNCVTVLRTSMYDSKASKRVKDGEILIDLREEEREENYFCNPSWWPCIQDQQT